jgi:hypothetical protein
MPKNTTQKTQTKTEQAVAPADNLVAEQVVEVKVEPVVAQKGKGKKTTEAPAVAPVAPQPQPQPEVKSTETKTTETKETKVKATKTSKKTQEATPATSAPSESTKEPVKTEEVKATKATKTTKAKTATTKKAKADKPAKQPRAKKTPVEKKPATEQEGGDSEEQGDQRRHFRLLKEDGTTEGRFAGRKPKQAANKVLTSLVNQYHKSGGDPVGKEFKFKIVECTRNSKCMEYEYAGTRIKLTKPNKVPIKDKDGVEIKTIVYKHVNRLHKVKKQPEVAVASA